MSDSEHEYSEEEEELTKELRARWRPKYILVAIDADQSMFVEHTPGKSSFTYSIEAISSLEDYLLFPPISSSKSPLGVITADCDDSTEPIARLEDSVLDTVKKFRELRKCTNKQLKEKFERKSAFDLSTFILLCKKEFMKIRGDPFQKVIVYITNNDNPVKNDSEKENVIREIETLPDIELSLHVVTMNENFNVKLLYSTLEAHNVKVTCTPDLLLLIDKLSTYVAPPPNRHKAILYPFKSRHDRGIHIVVNKPIKPASFKPNCHVTKDTHKKVVKLSNTSISERTPSSYSYQYSLQMPPVSFTNEEKEAIFHSDYPFGFTILATSKQLSEYGLVREPCTLIEKHKDDDGGIFDSFWMYCRNKNKVLLCARRYKIGKRVSVVELCPVMINNNVPMFRVTRLPNSDEINLPDIPDDVNTQESIPLDAGKLKALDDLVEHLRIKGDPIGFPDVVYRKKREYLKSQLLELDEVLEDVFDFEANDEKMDKYIRDVAEQFKTAFDLHEQGTKRKSKETQGKNKRK